MSVLIPGLFVADGLRAQEAETGGGLFDGLFGGLSERQERRLWGPAAWRGFVGLGAGFTPDYEGADSVRPIPVPVLRLAYRGYALRTEGIGLQLDVAPTQLVRAGPVAGFQRARDDNADDPRVALLPAVDASVPVGGFIAFRLPAPLLEDDAVSLGASAAQDVAGGHGGFLINAHVGYEGRSGPLLFDGRVTASWASEDYFDAYFTVSEDAARVSGLPAFEAGEGLKDVGARFSLVWEFADSWGVLGFLGYRRMVGDAADSPVTAIAGSPNQIRAGMAMTYRFGPRD